MILAKFKSKILARKQVEWDLPRLRLSYHQDLKFICLSLFGYDMIERS